MCSSIVSSLRKILLPPESRQELFLRTLYHRINATPFFVNRQVRKAAASYTPWREEQNRTRVEIVSNNETLPITTFLMQVEAGDEEAALKTIHSLPLQAVSRWKLVPVFKGGAQRFEVPDQINQQDQISSAIQVEKVTPRWLSEMETDFLVFCRAGDIFYNPCLMNFQLRLSPLRAQM